MPTPQFAPDCLLCRRNADPWPPTREAITTSPHWRVAHAPDTSLEGWLVVVAREHVTDLGQLPREAMADLGPLLADLSGALRQVVECEGTSTLQFFEPEVAGHLQLHVIPRAPGRKDTVGPAALRLLRAPERSRLATEDMDRLALQVWARMPQRA